MHHYAISMPGESFYCIKIGILMVLLSELTDANEPIHPGENGLGSQIGIYLQQFLRDHIPVIYFFNKFPAVPYHSFASFCIR